MSGFEIRDIIHGGILIDKHEIPVIDSKFIQRLRQIKQLGFGEYSYPSATHNRYIHSLGAMHVASLAFSAVFIDGCKMQGPPPINSTQIRLAKGFDRLRAVLRLASLLHDVGHGPLSHTTEFAMPDVKKINLPFSLSKNRIATHEDYTLKIILDSSLTPILEKAGKSFGFTPHHIASLISTDVEVDDDFFIEKIEGQSIQFQPVLRQIVSSELDADRMDYLRRDSVYAGVTYGEFDFNWLIRNLTAKIDKDCCYLALEHRALYSFEDFLISRLHMFLMVYFHHKSVIYDEMLKKYLEDSECPYKLSSDVEKYCDYTDAHLIMHLSESKNQWAKRIFNKNPYKVLLELHTGIPATKTADMEQGRLLQKTKKELTQEGVDFIESTSIGEFSKYAHKKKDPLFVRYDNHYSAPSFIPIEKCTDLFTRYYLKRSITRLYVSPDAYLKTRFKGRVEPFKYEESEI